MFPPDVVRCNICIVIEVSSSLNCSPAPLGINARCPDTPGVLCLAHGQSDLKEGLLAGDSGWGVGVTALKKKEEG